MQVIILNNSSENGQKFCYKYCWYLLGSVGERVTCDIFPETIFRPQWPLFLYPSMWMDTRITLTGDISMQCNGGSEEGWGGGLWKDMFGCENVSLLIWPEHNEQNTHKGQFSNAFTLRWICKSWWFHRTTPCIYTIQFACVDRYS